MSPVRLGSGVGFLVAVLAGALQVEAESTAETTALTLFDVTRTQHTEPSGVSRSWSRALQPAGTASDGSATTFSEEVIEYEMNVSGSATSTFSTTSWKAIRIQSASGYVRIQTASAFLSVQSCSYASGRGGCVEIVNNFSRVQPSSSGQTATTVTTATSVNLLAGEATLTPIQTLTIVNAVSVSSTPSSMPPVTNGGASSTSGSDVLKPALLGSLFGGMGLILLGLGLFLLCRRQRRKARGRKQTFSREVISNGGIGGIGGFDQHRYHYRSSRVAPSMIESSKDGVSIDSSYLHKSHRTKSPPHSPTNSFSAALLPYKSQVSPSPLSSIPYSAEPQPQLVSTKDTHLSQSSVVPSTSASSSSRQNTTDSTNSHSSSHPGHGFRIRPSRFIERLSLSSTYLESLMVGEDPVTLCQEPHQIDPEDSSHTYENQGLDHQPEHGQSSSSLPEAVTPTLRMDSNQEDEFPRPHSPPPSSPSPRDSPTVFTTPSQAPSPGMFSPSSSSLPPASQSALHPPHAHSRTPPTPTFLPPSTPQSWVTPSPFSHQSFRTAEEGEDDSDASTVERPRTALEGQSQSALHSRSPSDYFSTDHGGI